MDETRKKIIIQEINSWKESRMLPEQYCHYLLALYSQGEVEPIHSNKTRKGKREILSGLLMGALFVIIVFLNYFTEIPIVMQIVVTTISIITLGFLVRLYRKNKILFQLALIEMVFLMLVETVKLTELLNLDNWNILYSCLFIHCVLWVLIGKRYRLIYFTISGLLGIIVILYFLLM